MGLGKLCHLIAIALRIGSHIIPMSIPLLNRLVSSVFGKLSLRTVFTVPFMLQIVATGGLVGYFSWQNHRKSVERFQMMRQLRQVSELQNTIIVVISANAFAADRQKSLESGCNDFLSKLIQTEELLNKLKTYLKLCWIYEQEGVINQEVALKENSDVAAPLTVSPSELVMPPDEELFICMKR